MISVAIPSHNVQVKPTVILGLSGVGKLFTEEVIKEMYKHTKRPIVFPLSNPTDRAECTAQYAFNCYLVMISTRQAFEWTDTNAIFASGSPFQPGTFIFERWIVGDFESQLRWMEKCVIHHKATTWSSIVDCNVIWLFEQFIFPGMGLGAVAW